MLTPMTNIEQSVGRILRQKHDFEPLVVDIIDSHDNFQRQWQKRKAFYKKQNYKIIQTDSNKYNPNTSSSNWKLIFEPKRNVLSKCLDEKILLSSDSENNSNDDHDDDTTDKNKNINAGKCLLKFKK